MGLIHRWSWIAGEVPFLANIALRWPGVSALSKWLGGIAPERTMPRYARPFVHWHRRHGGKKGARGRVMLWPDTFNNYFRPQTAIAATKVLEALGYEVVVPPRRLCCGRPLYDWGMLDAAKRLWRKNLATLAPEIERGTPIVGLEPACVSAFRDELPGLFPSHERAQRLSQQTVLLSEFLQDEDLSAFHQSGAALVQLHCHHHAVLKPEAEKKVLEHVGVEHEVLSAGCCGMAGSFGFEAAKYDISMKAAERALLPRLRQAASDTAVLANGFSCREQIEQALHRPTLHLADLLARALPGEN
jgi:Fe-S oxidoreductase